MRLVFCFGLVFALAFMAGGQQLNEDEFENENKRGMGSQIRLVRSAWDNRIRLAKKSWDTRIRLAKKWDNRIRLAKKYMDWDKRIRLAKKSSPWDTRIRLAKKDFDDYDDEEAMEKRGKYIRLL